MGGLHINPPLNFFPRSAPDTPCLGDPVTPPPPPHAKTFHQLLKFHRGVLNYKLLG